MKLNTPLILLLSVLFIAVSCKKSEPIEITTDDFHASVDKVIEVMVHDIFSPPVTSRVFVYPNTSIYSGGMEELMNDAAWELKEHFTEHWGAKLLRALQALHILYVSGIDPSEKL